MYCNKERTASDKKKELLLFFQVSSSKYSFESETPLPFVAGGCNKFSKFNMFLNFVCF